MTFQVFRGEMIRVFFVYTAAGKSVNISMFLLKKMWTLGSSSMESDVLAYLAYCWEMGLEVWPKTPLTDHKPIKNHLERTNGITFSVKRMLHIVPIIKYSGGNITVLLGCIRAWPAYSHWGEVKFPNELSLLFLLEQQCSFKASASFKHDSLPLHRQDCFSSSSKEILPL